MLPFRHILIPLTVFLTGACVLVIEIVAVRVLSPYYGNTIYTVSSVISIILAALSAGYYYGGKLADRHPHQVLFYGIIALSGVLVLLLHWLGMILLPIFDGYFSLALGPLVATTVLFLVPATLLGTLSPFAVKLHSQYFPELGVGSVSGQIFFWSTLGSITGSLLAGFWLIPNLGINLIFMLTGGCLVILGTAPLILLGLFRRHQIFLLAVFIVSVSLLGLIKTTAAFTSNSVVYTADGVYEKITIYDTVSDGRPVRFFQQDRSASGGMYLDTDDPADHVFDYTRYYELYKLYTDDFTDALVIGGGIYTVPKAIIAESPSTTVVVSEIEPSLQWLGEQYFNVPQTSQIKTVTDDGRRFLQDADARFDLIFSDVYYSLYSIPSHFTTKEFFQLAYDRLTEDGVFVANLIGDLSRHEPSFIFSEIRTFQAVFADSHVIAIRGANYTGRQNIMLVGSRLRQPTDLVERAAAHGGSFQLPLAPKLFVDPDRYVLNKHPILTDDYAPAEYFTTHVLQTSNLDWSVIQSEQMIALIDQQLAYGPRYVGAPGHELTKLFLAAESKALADDVIVQSWDYPAKNGQVHQLSNIIARFNPGASKRVIVATHFDSKKHAENETKRISEPVPGANDSASGVAVMLELMRVLSLADSRPNIGIDFVFFDGEEGDPELINDYDHWEPIGSNYFADNIHDVYSSTSSLSAVVLDMVCDSDLQIYQDEFSLQHAPSQTERFWDIAQQVAPSTFVSEPKYAVYDDHTALNAIGIPSLLVIDFDYPYFHTTQDTIDKCSAESLRVVAETTLRYLYAQ